MLKETLILLLASAALSTAAVRPAFAQTAPSEVLLVNQNGCKLYHPVGSEVVEAQLLTVAGNCVDGFYSGAVIYGVSWSSKYRVQGVLTGFMKQGRIEGLSMIVIESLFVGLNRPSQTRAYTGKKGASSYNFAEMVDAITNETPKTDGTNASNARDHLVKIAAIWDRDPGGFFRDYAQDSNNPRVAVNNNLPPARTQGSTPQDDPKVFGRSARGG